MAININSDIFTGGLAEFNPRSVIPLYANLMARKQAKEDALNEYYQNLHKSVNPAGMRTKDIEGGFSKKVNDWQNYYFQNKDKIKNPRTPEEVAVANQHQSMYQDILMDINKSKEAAAQEMELAKQKISGKWNPTDSDLQIAGAIGSTIYSPEYYKDKDVRTQPYTLNDLSLNVPQFDPTAKKEFIQAYRGNLKPGKIYDELNTRKAAIAGQVLVPFEEKYTKDQVKQMAAAAGEQIKGSRSAKVYYERLLEDPTFLHKANEVYKEYFGDKNFAGITTPEQAAAADAIMENSAAVGRGEEMKRDEKWMLDYKQGLEKQMKQWENDLKLMTEEQKNTWLKDYLVDESNKARTDEFGKPKAQKVYNLGDGLSIAGNEIPVTSFIAKSFAKDGKTPDKLIVSDVNVAQPDGSVIVDRKYTPIFYKRDDKGNIEKEKDTPLVNRTLSVSQDLNSAVVDMGGQVGVKQKNVEGAALMNKPLETKKTTYSYKGKSYTPEQIQKAAEASGMTVEEYLKKAGIK